MKGVDPAAGVVVVDVPSRPLAVGEGVEASGGGERALEYAPSIPPAAGEGVEAAGGGERALAYASSIPSEQLSESGELKKE